MSENADSPGVEVCQPVPEIGREEIDDHSISHICGDGMYAPGVGFRVNGRKFELLDKDEDGTVDFVFSYGTGPEWCVDHEAIPNEVLDAIENELDPLDLDIPDDYRAEEDSHAE